MGSFPPKDDPLPTDLTPYLGKSEDGLGRTQQLFDLAGRENLTNQQALRFSAAEGPIQVVGSLTELANTIQEWIEGHAADGFNLVLLLPSRF